MEPDRGRSLPENSEMSALFTPLKVGRLTLRNRIVVAPMAQYSARDGSAVPWHEMHLGMLATSGAALVMIEGTCVEPRGRVTHACLGLYTDANEAALAGVIERIRSYSDTPLGIQLMHSGRKGSATIDSQGAVPLAADQSGWRTIAPSPQPFRQGWQVPIEATCRDLACVVKAFADSARRAARAGVQVVELHAAHGYLLHQFLSPLSNRRCDEYGGSAESRMRFPLEVFEAVRDACPDLTVGARITGSDWIEGGLSVDDAIAFALALEARGCDYVDVSSGGLDPSARITIGPGYQVEFAAAVKRHLGIPVRSVGLITSPQQAEAIIAAGKSDMIALGRAILAQPRWPWMAAHELGVNIDYPPQCQRAAPGKWPGWEVRA